jgi:hypothetical protein
MGGPDDRFGVARVTRKTALACLGRVCALEGAQLKSVPPQLHEASREEFLPIEQLIAIAHKSGLRLRTIRFDWFRLLAALSGQPALLVLENGNVIAAEKVFTSKNVVVFDPLAATDERFLVSRTELEPVWAGDALIPEPELARGRRSRTKAIALTAVCGFLIATLVILFAPKHATLVPRLFPAGGSSSLPAEALAQNRTSNPGKDALLDSRHERAPAENSELLGSTARQETGTENVPGADADQSSLEYRQPIADTKRSHPNEPPTVGSTRLLSGQSVLPQEENVPASPGPQTASTSSSSPFGTVPMDATRPMMLPEPAVLSPTPSGDKPEGISESAKAADAGNGARARSKLTSDEVKVLVARGDLLLGSGDVTSARLFYERAANAPDAQAALRLGESYDPTFLAGARLNRTAGSVPLAAQWYRRADELGAPEAATLLRVLAVETGISR